jgi:hypothetical protein
LGCRCHASQGFVFCALYTQAKVHQKALLAAGLVEGPTDPRLPTLRGLLRAGCHPDALKAFLLEQVCTQLVGTVCVCTWSTHTALRLSRGGPNNLLGNKYTRNKYTREYVFSGCVQPQPTHLSCR